MRPCPACDCHVLSLEPTCPHCGAALSPAPARARARWAAMGAGLSMIAACATDPDPGDTAASTTMMSGSTTDLATETGSSTDPDTSTSESTDTDGTDTSGTDTTAETDTEDDWGDTDGPAYGVPTTPCEDFQPEPLVVGANEITFSMDVSELSQNCGGSGTAKVYAFTATTAGEYEISLEGEVAGVISLYDDFFCDPFNELGCTLAPETLTQQLVEEQTIHIGVDSDEGPVDASATLTLTLL